MNVLIIEDEKPAAENLENLLLKIDRQIHIQAKIDTVEDAVNWLRKHQSDLIFLDIHLADDISFKIFEQVEVQSPIIFTTAYNQYAIRAFKLNSIDYLLKPIDEEEVRHSLDKFNKLKINANFDYKTLLDALQQKKIEYQKRFMVTTGEKVKSVLAEEIAYFFAQGKYVFLTTQNNQQFMVDSSLEKLEEVLDPAVFFRINRQFIIRFEAIKEMFAYPKGRIKIKLNPDTKEDTIVSLSKAVAFKNWLNK